MSSTWIQHASNWKTITNVANNLASLEIDKDLIPSTDSLYDIGSVNRKWNGAYIDFLYVSVDEHIGGALTVDGPTDVQELLVRGDLNVLGGISLTSLDLTGNATISGDIACASIHTTDIDAAGYLTVSGIFTCDSSIQVADVSTTHIQCSSIEVTADALISGSLNTIGGISNSGASTLQEISGTSLTLSSTLDVGGTLGVSGISTFANALKISTTKIIELGVGSTKETDAGKIGYNTFGLGSLWLIGAGPSVGNRRVWLKDNLVVDQDLFVNRDTAIIGDLSISGDFSITGSSTFQAITATSLSLSSTLDVGGASTLHAISGASLSLSSTLGVSGISTFGDALKISTTKIIELGGGTPFKETDAGKIGYDTFGSGFLWIIGSGNSIGTRRVWLKDDLIVGNDLYVNNNVRLEGTLTVTFDKIVEFGKGFTKQTDAGKIGYNTSGGDFLGIIGGGTSIGNRKVWLKDNLLIDQDLAVSRNADFTGALSVTGVSTLHATTATSLSLSSTLAVSGGSTLQAITATSLTLSSSIVATSLSLSSTLGVSGISTFGDALKISTTKIIELGVGSTKETDAGKIGYNTFGLGSLWLIGAGPSVGNRRVEIKDDLYIDQDLYLGRDGGVFGTFRVSGHTYLDGAADIQNNFFTTKGLFCSSSTTQTSTGVYNLSYLNFRPNQFTYITTAPASIDTASTLFTNLGISTFATDTSWVVYFFNATGAPMLLPSNTNVEYHGAIVGGAETADFIINDTLATFFVQKNSSILKLWRL